LTAIEWIDPSSVPDVGKPDTGEDDLEGVVTH
jgi:hypothetical protein